MLEIYFDGKLVDPDDYVDIKNNFKLFDETFFLGSATANTFTIEVPGTYSVPTDVKIKYKNKEYADLIVDKFNLKENNILNLTLIDKMVLFNPKIDISKRVPISAKNLLKLICISRGIEVGTEIFSNEDETISEYNSNLTSREYLKFIAELNGGYAQIGQDGKLYLKNFNTTPKVINVDDCEDFKLGEKRKIERVVFDNGILKFQTSENENLETLYLNSENPFITKEEVFNNIANKILNFEFYNFETKNTLILDNLIAGDLIKFKDGDKEYLTIAQYELDYNGSWNGGYLLNVNSKKQEETKQVGVNTKIKNLQVSINRNENKLNITAKEIEENKKKTNEKLAEFELKTDEISQKVSKVDENTKEISNIKIKQGEISAKIEKTFKFTRELKFKNKIILNDIYFNGIVEIKITADLCKLYPSKSLYPSKNTYPLPDIFLVFKEKDTITKYPLDKSIYLRYRNEEEKDELVIKSGEMILINNLQITKDKLNVPKITKYNGIVIPNKEKNIEIYVDGYNDLNYEIKYIVDSELTRMYATKQDLAKVDGELKTEVKKTADGITQKVSRKVGSDEIISKINQSAESITIQANKLNLNGYATFTDLATGGKSIINGSNITTGLIKSNNYVYNQSGTTINLEDGFIDTKNFKVDANGNLNCINGTIRAANVISDNFSMNSNGSISSKAGTIAGWNISPDRFSNANSYMSKNGDFAFYPRGGSVVAANSATRIKGPSGVAIYNSYIDFDRNENMKSGVHLSSDQGDLTLNVLHSNGRLYIRNYLSGKNGVNTSERSILIAAAKNIGLHSETGDVTARGVSGSGKIKTTSGDASSKKLKTNIKKFKKNDIDNALEVLNKINLYKYNYKYAGFGKKENRFGFIIDEIEQIPGYENWFSFTDEVGYLKDGEVLKGMNEDGKKIEYKVYENETYDKFMLTVVKGLLNKINHLEKEIEKWKK